MSGHAFAFAGSRFVALGSGALFWPAQNALIAADLHLGKSERMARRGGALLPPFETRDTLHRLNEAIEETRAQHLFLLGDVFDDNTARDAVAASDAHLWRRMTQRLNCCILGGNHDPSARTTITVADVTLRHIASAGPDISGHYHPKARLLGTTRPAFLIGQNHLILPAFGTFTGGLSVDDPALAALVPQGLIIMTGKRALAFPFGHATT